MKKNIVIILVWCLTLVMSGCGGKIRYPTYYTLELPQTPRSAASDHQSLGTLAVRPFATPAYLRQGRIVYREAPNQVGFYDYHRWAADPGATITTVVIETFRSSGLFALVEPYDGHDKPEYLMTGRLERLDEIDYGGAVRVEAKISVQLMALRTGTTLWAGDATETSAVETRTVNSVVAAMGKAVHASIDQLMKNMYQKLAGAAAASSSVRASRP